VLLADIGGSTSRFALAARGERPHHIVVVSNATVATLEAAIAQYLEFVGMRPTTAIFAVAAPISGNEVALTNRAWRFRTDELGARFGFRHFRVVNDFEALAWALLSLGADDIRPIGPRLPGGDGVKVVVGPGTGLGVAALLPEGPRWRVMPSEGGHSCFGPGPRDEIPVFDRLWQECGQVSAEMILSGAGLHRLYRAVNCGSSLPDPETIVGMAKAGDPSALETTSLFLRLLGRFAGSLALTFKATGGVYVAGGVVAALTTLIDDEQFRGAFEGHRPHQSLLAAIPTALITCQEPGLRGCGALAEQMADARELASGAELHVLRDGR
jgi:glucokinase